jgi:hypothetical protein
MAGLTWVSVLYAAIYSTEPFTVHLSFTLFRMEQRQQGGTRYRHLSITIVRLVGIGTGDMGLSFNILSLLCSNLPHNDQEDMDA